jgi:hypothetical protein
MHALIGMSARSPTYRRCEYALIGYLLTGATASARSGWCRGVRPAPSAPARSSSMPSSPQPSTTKSRPCTPAGASRPHPSSASPSGSSPGSSSTPSTRPSRARSCACSSRGTPVPARHAVRLPGRQVPLPPLQGRHRHLPREPQGSRPRRPPRASNGHHGRSHPQRLVPPQRLGQGPRHRQPRVPRKEHHPCQPRTRTGEGRPSGFPGRHARSPRDDDPTAGHTQMSVFGRGPAHRLAVPSTTSVA